MPPKIVATPKYLRVPAAKVPSAVQDRFATGTAIVHPVAEHRTVDRQEDQQHDDEQQ